MALPYTVAFNLAAIPERISQAADVVQGKHGSQPAELAFWVDGLNAALGLPRTLKDVGLSEADVPAMITECAERYPRPTNPAPINAERLKVFYETMVTGDLALAVEFYQRG